MAQGCGMSPCLHGGNCTDLDGDDWRCQCAELYTGDTCQFGIDSPCASSPCQNDGLCFDDGSDGGYTCACFEDYRGTNCEDKIPLDSPCLIDQCLMRGTCLENSNATNGFTCLCFEDYTGTLCTSRIPRPCESTEGSICENGGTCQDTDGEGAGYVCVCPEGYSGQKCGVRLQPSTTSPTSLFQTRDAQSSPVPRNVSLCAPQLCMHGGTCLQHPTDPSGYTCICDENHSGERCAVVLQPDSPNGSLPLILAGGGALLLFLLILIVSFICTRRSKRRKRRGAGSQSGDLSIYRFSHSWPDNLVIPIEQRTNKEFPKDRLVIYERVGSGAFANVARGEAHGILSLKEKTTVAVKMLRDDSTETEKRNFMGELELHKMLDMHPNVVSMYGYCTTSAGDCLSTPYIILEYMGNGNLLNYMRDVLRSEWVNIKTDEAGEGKIWSEEALETLKGDTDNQLMHFALQIATGMEYLATKHCIHRDLAARNILLGDDLVCKVSDFGLARELQERDNYEMNSKNRLPVRWMAPETLMKNSYTIRSDVWSFGVLLWEIATLGSHPYAGLTPREVLDAIQNGVRLEKPEHCDDEMYSMMARCWEVIPEDRPDFTNIRSKLDNLLDEEQNYLLMDGFSDESYVFLWEADLARHGSTDTRSTVTQEEKEGSAPRTPASLPSHELDV